MRLFLVEKFFIFRQEQWGTTTTSSIVYRFNKSLMKHWQTINDLPLSNYDHYKCMIVDSLDEYMGPPNNDYKVVYIG